MKQVEERYISLLTDFGFDRLFEEAEIATQYHYLNKWSGLISMMQLLLVLGMLDI